MTLRLALLLAIGFAAACEHSTPGRQGGAQSSGQPWYLADASCDFDPTVTHPDPIALAQEFVARDARGEFLQSTTWFNGATNCPGHEPGPDALRIVQGFRIAFDTVVGDTIRARVTYRVLGTLAGGNHIQPDSGTEVRVLKLTKGPVGWRIESPALDQHLTLDVVVTLRWLPDSLRRRLLAIAKSRGA